jgi:hypothetical protein
MTGTRSTFRETETAVSPAFSSGTSRRSCGFCAFMEWRAEAIRRLMVERFPLEGS